MTLKGLRKFFFGTVPNPNPGYQSLALPTGSPIVPVVPVVIDKKPIPKAPPPVAVKPKVVAETRSVIDEDLEARRRRAREEDEEDERRRRRQQEENDSLFTTIAAVEIASSFDQPSYDPGPSYSDPSPSFDAGGGSFGGGGSDGSW